MSKPQFSTLQHEINIAYLSSRELKELGPMKKEQKEAGIPMRLRVRFLASLSGLRIWHCCELWDRSQMWLRSGVAVAVVWASSYSSDETPSLGTSICHRCGPKKKKKKERKRKKKRSVYLKDWKGDSFWRATQSPLQGSTCCWETCPTPKTTSTSDGCLAKAVLFPGQPTFSGWQRWCCESLAIASQHQTTELPGGWLWLSSGLHPSLISPRTPSCFLPSLPVLIPWALLKSHSAN